MAQVLNSDLPAVIHPQIALTYASVDITSDITADLLSLTYTDLAGDEADTLSVSLKDDEGKWADAWSPTRGDTVAAKLITNAYDATLSTGAMYIDTLTYSGGQGTTVSFEAQDVPLATPLRRKAQTRTFEQVSLETLISQLASEHGLSTSFTDCEALTAMHDRIDQRRESDLALMKRLCSDAGLLLNVFDGTITIISRTELESATPIAEYVRTKSPILSYTLRAQQSERYSSATLTWRDLRQKTASQTAADKMEYISYTAEDTTIDGGQEYTFSQRVTSLAEARTLAEARLHELNLRQMSGSLSVIGNPALCAGACITLTDFGAYDGEFCIDRATHTIDSSGYITTCEVHKCNNSY